MWLVLDILSSVGIPRYTSTKVISKDKGLQLVSTKPYKWHLPKLGYEEPIHHTILTVTLRIDYTDHLVILRVAGMKKYASTNRIVSSIVLRTSLR